MKLFPRRFFGVIDRLILKISSLDNDDWHTEIIDISLDDKDNYLVRYTKEIEYNKPINKLKEQSKTYEYTVNNNGILDRFANYFGENRFINFRKSITNCDSLDYDLILINESRIKFEYIDDFYYYNEVRILVKELYKITSIISK